MVYGQGKLGKWRMLGQKGRNKKLNILYYVNFTQKYSLLHFKVSQNRTMLIFNLKEAIDRFFTVYNIKTIKVILIILSLRLTKCAVRFTYKLLTRKILK